MRILGISAFYHDSAAALIEDGRILAAAQEERFTRRKHDARFPEYAIAYCLEAAGVGLDDVDHVVFFEKPLVKFERLLETYLANAPRGFRSFKAAMPVWIKEKLFQKSNLEKALKPFSASGDVGDKLLFAEHHQSHAASAFFASPFEEAVVLTLDGVGEWATTSVVDRPWQHARDGARDPLAALARPALFGLHLLHGLSASTRASTRSWGSPPMASPATPTSLPSKLIDLKDDGSFWLDQSYFNYATGLTMTSRKFDALFGGPPRKPDEPLTQREMDLAASVQKVTEDVMLRMTRELAQTYRIRNLCLAGGVALNCVANGKILRDGQFRSHLGAAGGRRRRRRARCRARRQLPASRAPRQIAAGLDAMQGSFLGPVLCPGRHRAPPRRRPALASMFWRARSGLWPNGRQPRRWRRRRLVPGPHGVRPARARRPLDPRRSPQSGHAEDSQSQDQVSRELPALCAVGAAR